MDLDTYDNRKMRLTDWAHDCFTEAALDVLVNWEAEALDDIKEAKDLCDSVHVVHSRKALSWTHHEESCADASTSC